jgi:hypothetical protein
MSEQNGTVVRDYFEKVLNRHDWAASDELVDDVVDRSDRPGLLPRLE